MTPDDKGRMTQAIASDTILCNGYLNHIAKPGKFWCKLCRESGIKNRNSHLKNKHSAHTRIFSKRVDKPLLQAIFLECV